MSIDAKKPSCNLLNNVQIFLSVQYCEESVIEEAMMKFSKLLGNKNFLLIFIQTLDTGSRSKMSVKERWDVWKQPV